MSAKTLTFVEAELPGVFVVSSRLHADPRGSFGRMFDRAEFERHGLDPHVSQSSVSYNERAGTVRGMHWQAAPRGENKLVTCLCGRVYDVVADVRPDSPTFGKWQAIELAGVTFRGVTTLQMLYVPAGVAHGFQTLEDHAVVHYQMSVDFDPTLARGFRWDDPSFSIPWPLPVAEISDRDRNLPYF